MKTITLISLLCAILLPVQIHGNPPPEQFERIAELVEAGKHREALGQVRAFLTIWPDNEDLQSLERMLVNATAGEEQRAAPPRQEKKPTPSITPADQLEIETVVGGVRSAINVRDTQRRERDLRAILNRRVPANANTAPWVPYWQARAVAALQLDDLEVGWRAGQQLKALDAISSTDSALRQVMAELNLKGWLEDDLQSVKQARERQYWEPWIGEWEASGGTSYRLTNEYGRVDKSLKLKIKWNGNNAEIQLTRYRHTFQRIESRRAVTAYTDEFNYTIPGRGLYKGKMNSQPTESIDYVSVLENYSLMNDGSVLQIAYNIRGKDGSDQRVSMRFFLRPDQQMVYLGDKTDSIETLTKYGSNLYVVEDPYNYGIKGVRIVGLRKVK